MNWLGGDLSILWLAIGLIAVCGASAWAVEPIGINNMLALDRLPFLKDGVTVRYEGSIDKQGGNADYDWWLYHQGDEWVLLDVDGPGCIYNFVQHRYPSSVEPTFRFYFDGEDKPRFVIRQSEFGKKAPFVEPLASIFVGDDPVPSGRGPIWVVRSFVPMPFARSCRVTSSVKLEGFDRAKGEGGWGHIIYHSYPTAEGVTTFTGTEDYGPLRELWRRVGKDPKSTSDNEHVTGTVKLDPGASARVLSRQGEGSVASIRLTVGRVDERLLQELWIRLRWDGHARPDVECPLGSFFGNEFGYHDQRFLTHGMTVSGDLYNYFPMPFWKSAEIELVNKGTRSIGNIGYEVQFRPSSKMRYPQQRCGYFRASTYYPNTPVAPGRDSLIASVSGCGHVVAGHVCGRPVKNTPVSCEGDLRVYVDGNRTPQVESDGSESWGCYGWGFPTPPQNNPTSGYDGSGPELFTWSEVRVCTGDWYPFRSGLAFNMEAGGHNDWPMAHSGIIFYYGQDVPGDVLTDTVDVGNTSSEEKHAYQVSGQATAGELEACYEGTDDTLVVKDDGRAFRGASEFTISVRPDNAGVLLRRRSDQAVGRQHARVYVDGKPVTERTWYYADRNPYKRWLDDEFEIPLRYTAGRDSLRIRIEPVNASGEAVWNEYHYWVFSHIRRA